MISHITINYAPAWNNNFTKTTTSSDTSFISSPYKIVETHPYTDDATTADEWRDFILRRGKRKFWTITFKTFMNGIQLELFDIINVRHPILTGLFGSSEENAKKWAEKVETEEEKKIYLPNCGRVMKPKSGLADQEESKTNENDEVHISSPVSLN